MEKALVAKYQTIIVQNKFDIVEARMCVRTMARQAGFDLFDQARISLATSALASILEMEHAEQGQITVEHLKGIQRAGIKVVCKNPNPLLHSFASEVFDDARRMVDDLFVEHMPSTGVRVTLVKWVNGKDHRSSAGKSLVERETAHV
jgi:anti-sigma regulatory factor (Ser/Thr protein kinase)